MQPAPGRRRTMVQAGRKPALPGIRRPHPELHAQSGSGLAGHGPTCLPSPLVVPCAASRRAISPSRPTVRHAGELAQSSRYARSWPSRADLVRASLFAGAVCTEDRLPGGEPAGTSPLPGRCPASGGVLPGLGRIGPRPHGSDRSVSVRPIDATAASSGQFSTLDTKILDKKDDVMVSSNEAEVTGRIHRICETPTLAECCARARQIAPARLSHRASRSSPRPERGAAGNVTIRLSDRLRAVALQPPAVRPRGAGARAGVSGPGVLRALVPPQWLRGFGRGDRAAFAWLATGAAAAPPATMEW